MHHFDELFDIAAGRKGGAQALEGLLSPPTPTNELKAITDDRWLAGATKSVFYAGFNWKVVDSMWPGFEEAFNGFNIYKCANLDYEDFDRLTQDRRIVRYGAKIKAVQENAVFFLELAEEHGSAANAIVDWPATDYVGLLETLKKRGTRLGGTTGQYWLRQMGRDSFILSRDVVTRLIAEGIIDKAPTSKKALAAVQDAFNTWSDQSGRSLTEISRVLAMSL